MGYTTTFTGHFTLDRPLTPAHAAYLTQFAAIRHMSRVAAMLKHVPDPIRSQVHLPLGVNGEYFVGDETSAIATPSLHPCTPDWPSETQPGIWCNWTPTADRCGLEWDGGEKFYYYGTWLLYLLGHFLLPWGYVLSGTVTYQGEDPNDSGSIEVAPNGMYGMYIQPNDMGFARTYATGNIHEMFAWSVKK